jgi:D-alanyl-D-alanine dipeptidase
MPEPEASETSIEYYALDVIETVRGKESWLVDVRRYIPDIEYVMIFSTPDNFTGVPLYSRDACMLQKGTVEKLMRAQELFALDGYTIKIYDAYRPSMVSGMLYGIIQDTTYIARAGTSTHNRAAAIDITLVDVETGKELLMPSPMHTFNITSSRGFWGMPSEARANMNYMTSVMVRCGFTTLSTEWWHFNDSDKLKYPPLDYPISAFAYEAVDLEALDDEDADGDGSDATQPTDGDGADGDWFGDGWFGAGDAGDNDAKPEDRDEWFGEGGTEAG